MNLEQIRNEVLKALFDGYKEYGGGGFYKLEDIVDPLGQSGYEIGSYLKEEGVIRDTRFFPNETQTRISIAGIREIDPDYFEAHASTIMSTLGISGNQWMGIRTILEWGPEHDSRARDIANAIEGTKLFEFQYQDDVYVKLTLKGQDFYEKNKPRFMN